MSLDPSAVPFSATSIEHHGPSLAHSPPHFSSSTVSQSSPNARLPLTAAPRAIPTTVAISTAISTVSIFAAPTRAASTHETVSYASRNPFTDSTTTMQPFQSIQHGFHANMPSDCHHHDCCTYDDYNFQETLHLHDAI